jgi:glucokinase
VVELALAEPRRGRVGVPVVVENEASCGGWGERSAGSGQGRQHVLLVTLGTGIGGGIVLGGRLYRGHHGFAGEIGHMVVDPDGPPCPCGQRGCWERYASGSGLGRIAREAAIAGRAARVVELAGGDPELVKGEHVTAAAAEGDESARRVMADFGWWVALGLANLANAFDPELFVLGGGLVEAGDVLLDPVRSAFADLLEGADHRPPVGIVAATLGERAGAIGAALLARDAR